MPNKKINELSPRTPSLTDLIIVGDPSTGYSYKATISVLTAFAGSNIQFSSLGGISLTSPANGQVLQFNGTSWVNYTPTTWNTAYDRSLVSAAVSGSTTKTLTLTKQDGSTLTATWSDLNTDAVTSVFGRTGAVVATEGDYSLDLLSDVTLSTPTTNQVLQYNGTAWVNATFVAGINSLNGLTATTQTFAVGTSGTDFAISSTTSTHTFNLPTASATNRGALSSADWTTFNSKVGGSGTTNYLSKWTSSSALGNSLVLDDGSNVFVQPSSGNAFLGIRSASGSFYPTLGFYSNATSYTNIQGYLTNMYFTAAGGLFFQTSSERMRLTTAGRLLIGTTTESTYLLDVSGTFRSTGDANINGLTVGRGGGSVATNTAVGSSALNANTTGARNTAIGSGAGAVNTTSSDNTYIGNNAGQSATGQSNTAIGANSADRLTSGANNTFVGRTSGYATTTGGANVYVGMQAGYDGTTGGGNVAIGYNTGRGITTGNYNTIIGSEVTGLSASLSNTIILADGQGNQRLVMNSSLATIGTDASINGLRVGRGGGNAAENTAIGFQALNATNTGSYNVAVGWKALTAATTGSNNIGIGTSALIANTSGNFNVAIGINSGYSNTSGSSNTFIGYLSGFNNINGTSNVIVGSNAGFNVNSGTTNTIVGALSGSAVTSGGGNALIGYRAGVAITTGSSNICLGNESGITLTTGIWNTIISPYNAGFGITTGNYNTIIGPVSGLSSSLANHTIIADGQGNMRLVAFNDGNVFIGGSTSLPTNAGYKLDVNGTARVSGKTYINTGTDQGSYFIQVNGAAILGNTEIRTFGSGAYISLGTSGNITCGNNDIWFTGNFSRENLRLNQYGGVVVNNANLSMIDFQIKGETNSNLFYADVSANGIGIGTSSPNASALLDVSSTTKGFLPPRGTNAQMVAIATPATGLMFFDTTNNKLNVYDGTNWVAVH